MKKKDYEKKSFILYADLISVIVKIVEKDRVDCTNNAGELFLHILEYVNDMNPEPKNFIVDMAFEPIKLQLKRDLKKYEVIREKRIESGRTGGLNSAKVRSEIKQTKQMLNLVKQNEANEAVTVNDTVTVTVTDTVIKKEKYNNIKDSDIEEIYAAYPTKCLVSARSTGKSSKDKLRIAKLLKEKSMDELLNVITKYKDDCRSHKTYMKNFATFLNNIPDYPIEVKEERWDGEKNNKKEEIEWQE